MKPYLVCVVLHPTQKQKDEDDAVDVILVESKTVLANDESNAKAKAMRFVDEKYLEKDHRLEVFVLPFCR